MNITELFEFSRDRENSATLLAEIEKLSDDELHRAKLDTMSLYHKLSQEANVRMERLGENPETEVVHLFMVAGRYNAHTSVCGRFTTTPDGIDKPERGEAFWKVTCHACRKAKHWRPI